MLRGGSPDARERWLAALRALMPGAPFRRVPSTITDDRLLGGLDFVATMSAARPVAERGVLASAHGGVIILQADGTRRSTWSHITRALDDGEVRIERDGIAELHDASFAAIALEDADGRPVPASFADRVAFHIDLDDEAQSGFRAPTLDALAAARARLREVVVDDAAIRALVRGAQELGIGTPPIALAALAVARAHAALHERTVVVEADLAAAARLVLAPRALMVPEMSSDDNVANTDEAGPPPSDPMVPAHEAIPSGEHAEQQCSNDASSDALASVVVRAARAALPPGLLAAAAVVSARALESPGRAGEERAAMRGRQVGTRRGDPRSGARLDLVATLRTAAPFQSMRKRERCGSSRTLVDLRLDDLRIRRCVSHASTTTVFVLDASGSAALHRLAEAKGAVELMLAEGYARRERVAIISFRGATAELVLPPTHALARARRAIAALPAGGGTPLATALDLALLVVRNAARDGSQLSAVILTDGRANVARNGKGGRASAEADALDAARRLGALGVSTVFIDTSSRQDRFPREIAAAMNARYVALPAPTAHGLATLSRGARAAEVSAHG